MPAHLDGKEQNWLLLRKDAPQADGQAIRPQLASLTERLPEGPEWLFEPKWDGYRAIVTVDGGEARLTSRNGKDLTERFREVARNVTKAVRTPSAVLDGEVCALDEEGTARFEALQRGSGPLVLMAFDLLELDGEPVRERPLRERRELLEELLDPAVRGVRLSPAFEDGDALLHAAQRAGPRGRRRQARRPAVPARAGGRPSGRSSKLRAQEDFPIVGYTRGEGRRTKLGALVLARRESDGLHWAGNVGSGIGDDEVERLRALLEPLERATSPARRDPTHAPRPREGRHLGRACPRRRGDVTPRRRARAVSARRCTSGSATMFPVERPPIEPEIRRGRRVLRLSNLDKPFWPEEGITKGDLLAYYRDVAEALVPHLRKRPFTMKRYPDGWQGKSFFQKQAPSHMPDWIGRAPFPASTREGEQRVIDYALIDDELALLWAVNMGCIDMHAWASRADRADRPDWVMFDLDPSEGSGFEEVIEVARLVRQALDLLELESVPKTSGSRGIHVLVPIARRHDFAEVREFAGIVAGALARAHPGPGHDRVDEGEAQGRPRRREPERPGQDDCLGLLGPAAGRRARLDAAPLGRGAGRPRSHGVHDGSGARARRARGRSVRPGARGRPVARRGPARRSLSADRRWSLPRPAVSVTRRRARPLCTVSERLRRHGSRRRGWPSADSSTTSRRKNSETVQSATTRTFRRNVGSA